ncbi:MAG: hypothetical protein JXR56_03975 [Candidatus Cloacimonetes bacterium]|nr:hypothetical protein [Candidatus Cloacimonadota bacterium]
MKIDLQIKPLIVIVLLTLAFTMLLAQERSIETNRREDFLNSRVMLYKYQIDYHQNQRLSLGMNMPMTNNYIIDMELGSFPWVVHDKYNDNIFNFSIFSFIDATGILLFTAFLPNDLKATYGYLPIWLTNSSHNFYLNGKPDFEFNTKSKQSLKLALFAKNNTNYYIWMRNPWFEISPGLGVKLCLSAFSLDIGFERDYRIRRKKCKFTDGAFVSVSTYFPMNHK